MNYIQTMEDGMEELNELHEGDEKEQSNDLLFDPKHLFHKRLEKLVENKDVRGSIAIVGESIFDSKNSLKVTDPDGIDNDKIESLSSLSYLDFKEKTDHIAYRIASRWKPTGAEPKSLEGDVVITYLGRSIETVLAMYGIAKAGGAFLNLVLEKKEDGDFKEFINENKEDEEKSHFKEFSKYAEYLKEPDETEPSYKINSILTTRKLWKPVENEIKIYNKKTMKENEKIKNKSDKKKLIDLKNINVYFLDEEVDKNGMPVKEGGRPLADMINVVKKGEEGKYGAFKEDKCHINRNQLAYVKFTSGSTGTPKGVMIPHSGIIGRLDSELRLFAETDSLENLAGDNFVKERVAQLIDHRVDASFNEMLLALGTGAELHLIDKETISNGESLWKFLEVHKITTAILTPSLLKSLAKYADGNGLKNNEENWLPNLKRILTTGEKADIGLIRRFLKCKGRKIQNGCGSTEDTFGDTIENITEESFVNLEGQQYISIGKPMTGTKLLIVERKKKYDNELNVLAEINKKGEVTYFKKSKNSSNSSTDDNSNNNNVELESKELDTVILEGELVVVDEDEVFASIALGYSNNKDKTEKSFLKIIKSKEDEYNIHERGAGEDNSESNDNNSKRAYLTNDKVRLVNIQKDPAKDPIWKLLIRGRYDRVVKPYGRQVNLDEVEYRIHQVLKTKILPNLDVSIAEEEIKKRIQVHLRKDNKVVAFINPIVLNADNKKQNIGDVLCGKLKELRIELEDYLSDYAIPSRWSFEFSPFISKEGVFKEKTDKDLLEKEMYSKANIHILNGLEPEEECIDVNSQEEKSRVAKILKDLMSSPDESFEMGEESKFKYLGGNSMLAIEASALIQKEFQVTLKPGFMIGNRSVKEIVDEVLKKSKALKEFISDPDQKSDKVFTGSPLFFMGPCMGFIQDSYDALKAHLLINNQYYNLYTPGEKNESYCEKTFEKQAKWLRKAILAKARHDDESKPYILCGYSSGGIVAYEIARQLKLRGHQAIVILLDAPSPNAIQNMSYEAYYNHIIEKFVKNIQKNSCKKLTFKEEFLKIFESSSEKLESDISNSNNDSPSWREKFENASAKESNGLNLQINKAKLVELVHNYLIEMLELDDDKEIAKWQKRKIKTMTDHLLAELSYDMKYDLDIPCFLATTEDFRKVFKSETLGWVNCEEFDKLFLTKDSAGSENNNPFSTYVKNHLELLKGPDHKNAKSNAETVAEKMDEFIKKARKHIEYRNVQKTVIEQLKNFPDNNMKPVALSICNHECNLLNEDLKKQQGKPGLAVYIDYQRYIKTEDEHPGKKYFELEDYFNSMGICADDRQLIAFNKWLIEVFVDSFSNVEELDRLLNCLRNESNYAIKRIRCNVESILPSHSDFKTYVENYSFNLAAIILKHRNSLSKLDFNDMVLLEPKALNDRKHFYQNIQDSSVIDMDNLMFIVQFCCPLINYKGGVIFDKVKDYKERVAELKGDEPIHFSKEWANQVLAEARKALDVNPSATTTDPKSVICLSALLNHKNPSREKLVKAFYLLMKHLRKDARNNVPCIKLKRYGEYSGEIFIGPDKLYFVLIKQIALGRVMTAKAFLEKPKAQLDEKFRRSLPTIGHDSSDDKDGDSAELSEDSSQLSEVSETTTKKERNLFERAVHKVKKRGKEFVGKIRNPSKRGNQQSRLFDKKNNQRIKTAHRDTFIIDRQIQSCDLSSSSELVDNVKPGLQRTMSVVYKRNFVDSVNFSEEADQHTKRVEYLSGKERLLKKLNDDQYNSFLENGFITLSNNLKLIRSINPFKHLCTNMILNELHGISIQLFPAKIFDANEKSPIYGFIYENVKLEKISDISRKLQPEKFSNYCFTWKLIEVILLGEIAMDSSSTVIKLDKYEPGSSAESIYPLYVNYVSDDESDKSSGIKLVRNVLDNYNDNNICWREFFSTRNRELSKFALEEFILLDINELRARWVKNINSLIGRYYGQENPLFLEDNESNLFNFYESMSYNFFDNLKTVKQHIGSIYNLEGLTSELLWNGLNKAINESSEKFKKSSDFSKEKKVGEIFDNNIKELERSVESDITDKICWVLDQDCQLRDRYLREVFWKHYDPKVRKIVNDMLTKHETNYHTTLGRVSEKGYELGSSDERKASSEKSQESVNTSDKSSRKIGFKKVRLPAPKAMKLFKLKSSPQVEANPEQNFDVAFSIGSITVTNTEKSLHKRISLDNIVSCDEFGGDSEISSILCGYHIDTNLYFIDSKQNCIFKYDEYDSKINAVAIVPEKNEIITYHDDHTLRVLNVSTKESKKLEEQAFNLTMRYVLEEKSYRFSYSYEGKNCNTQCDEAVAVCTYKSDTMSLEKECVIFLAKAKVKSISLDKSGIYVGVALGEKGYIIQKIDDKPKNLKIIAEPCDRIEMEDIDNITLSFCVHEKQKAIDNIKIDELSPINLACYNGQLVKVKELYDEGADLLEKDASGKSALDYAKLSLNVEVIKYVQLAIDQFNESVKEISESIKKHTEEISNMVKEISKLRGDSSGQNIEEVRNRTSFKALRESKEREARMQPEAQEEQDETQNKADEKPEEQFNFDGV